MESFTSNESFNYTQYSIVHNILYNRRTRRSIKTESEVKILSSFKESIMKAKQDFKGNLIIYEKPMVLGCMALTRIAVNLWKNQEISDDDYTTGYYSPSHYISHNSLHIPRKILPHWPTFESKVLEKVCKLKLPDYYEKALKKRVKLVGMNLYRFFYTFYSNKINQVPMKFYCDRICWTNQGTVNYVKTFENIFKSDLNTIDKYIIACNMFLKNEIQILEEQLPPDFINWYMNDEHYLYKNVLFWTFHSRGEDSRFSDIVKTNQIYHYMFYWAVKRRNELGMQYIWSNFGDEKMEAQLIEFIPELFYDADFLCSIISLISEIRIESVYNINVYKLIAILIDDWRWHDTILPVVQYVLMDVKIVSCWEACEILFTWQECAFKEGQYKYLFTEYMDRFHYDLIRDFGDICLTYMSSLLFKDEMLIKLFLSKGAIDNKRQIAQIPEIIGTLIKLVIKGNLSALKLFIQEMIGDETLQKNYKRDFLLENGQKICYYLVSDENYKLLDEFLNSFCFDLNIFDSFEFILQHMGVKFCDPCDGTDPSIRWCIVKM